MKKITSILLLVTTCLTSSLYAQDKFGHIHSEQLLMIMPETADADKAIQEYSQMLETQLQAMYGEYQTKAGTFRWEFVTQDKEDEYSLTATHEVIIQ